MNVYIVIGEYFYASHEAYTNKDILGVYEDEGLADKCKKEYSKSYYNIDIEYWCNGKRVE